MIGEVDIGGVLFPPLLVWLGLALAASALLRTLLQRLHVYDFVWHRPLFDFLITLVLLGAVSLCANTLF